MVTSPSQTGEEQLKSNGALRSRVINANDGIIATAGIVEGFAGAGAGEATILVAALAAMVAGSISLAGASYAETAAERDAHLALLEDERRRLAMSPDQELAELATLYEAKGLSPDLARQVATQLSDRDPLAAHAEAEYGIDPDDTPSPVRDALEAGVAFALGSAVPLLVISLTPPAWRIPMTFLAVVAALCVTSYALSRSGRTNVLRTVGRTVAVGVLAMSLTLIGGSLFDL